MKHGTRPTDRLSQPPHSTILNPMNQSSWQATAHLRPNRAHLSFLPASPTASPCRAHLRKGCKRAHLFPIRSASLAHSFHLRLFAPTPGFERNESAAGPPESPAGHLKRPKAFSDFSDQARISEVTQDSDFRTEIGVGKNCVLPPSLRASGARRETSQLPITFNSVCEIFKLISRRGIPIENLQPFSSTWSVQPEASRASQRCIKRSVSKPRRRPSRRSSTQSRSRIRSIRRFSCVMESQARPGPRKLRRLYEGGNDFRAQVTWRSRLDLEYPRRDLQPENVGAPDLASE